MRIRIRNAHLSKVLIFDSGQETLQSLTLKIAQKLCLTNSDDQQQPYSLMLQNGDADW